MKTNIRDMTLAAPIMLSPASRTAKHPSESALSPATNGRNLQSATPTGTWYTTHRIGRETTTVSAFPEPGASTPPGHLQSASSSSSVGRNSTPPTSGRKLWMPDKSCKTCYNCHASFTLFRRRHHCRLCGLIFCHKCSDNFINGNAYGYPREMIRVCNVCLQQVREEAAAKSSQATTGTVAPSPLLFSPVNVTAAGALLSKGVEDEAVLMPTPPPSHGVADPSTPTAASPVPDFPASSSPKAPAWPLPPTPLSPPSVSVAEETPLLSPKPRITSPPTDGLEVDTNAEVSSVLPSVPSPSPSPSSKTTDDALPEPIELSPVPASPREEATLDVASSLSQSEPSLAMSSEPSLASSPSQSASTSPPASPQALANPMASPLLVGSSAPSLEHQENDGSLQEEKTYTAVLKELGAELHDPIEDTNEATAAEVSELVETCVELSTPPPLFTIRSSDESDFAEMDSATTTTPPKPFPAKHPSLNRRRRSSIELIGAIESSGLLANEPPIVEEDSGAAAGPIARRPPLKRDDKSFRIKTDSHTQREIVLDKYMTAAHERIREGIQRSVDRVMKHFVGDGMEAKRLASSLEDMAFITTGHLLFSMNFRGDNGFNFDDLVKVKSIAVLPDSRSPSQQTGLDPYTFKWLAGCVVRKSLSHKQMARQIANPRILLLACGISYDRSSDTGKLSSLDALIESEKSYVGILVEKISMLEPDVIFVEKTVSRHAQELLRARGVAIILNVKTETLERIGQYTGAAVLTSVDHITQLNPDDVIGTCRSFYAETVPVVPDDGATPEASEGAPKPIQRAGSRSKTDTYLYLDGCDPLNGCTVLISGASKRKLRKLKELLRNVLSMTYRTLLEAHVLCDLGLGFSDWYRRTLCDAKDRMTWCTTCTLREYDTTTTKQRYYQCSRAKQLGIAPYSEVDISLGNFLTNEMEALTFRCRNSKCSYTMAEHVQTFSCTIGTVTVSFEEVPEKVSSGATTASGPAQNLLSLLSKLNGEPADTLPVSTTGVDEDDADCPTIVYGRWCRTCAVMISPFTPLKKYAYKYSLSRLLEVLFSETDGQSPHNASSTNGVGSSTCTHDFMKAHVLFFNVGRIVARMDFQRRQAVRLLNTPPFVVIRGIRRRRSTVSDRDDQLERAKVFTDAAAKHLDILKNLLEKLVVRFTEKIEYVEGVVQSCEDYDGVATDLLIEVALLKKLVATDHETFLKCIQGITHEEPATKQLAETDRAKRALYYVACTWIEEIQKLRKTIKTTLAIDAGVTPSTFSLSAFSFSTPTSQSPALSPRPGHSGSPRQLRPESKGSNPHGHERVPATEAASLNGADPNDANPLFSSSAGPPPSPKVPKNPTSTASTLSQSAPRSENKETTWRSVLWDMYKGMGRSTPGDDFDLRLPTELQEGHPSLSSRSNELVFLVNENVPITSVAYALGSQSYDEQLKAWKVTLQLTTKEQQAKPSECRDLSAQSAADWAREALSTPLNMHFKHTVSENPRHHGLLNPSGNSSFGCWDFSTVAFFPLQFEAMREIFYGELPEFLFSISHVKNWDALGGKSGASFFRSLDDRFVIKHISSTEQQSFLEVLPSYFKHTAKIYFDETPSVISKIVGMYQTTITKKETGQRTTHHIIVMENAFYGHQVARIFDLKGLTRNRYIKPGADGKPSGVQLDGNLIELTEGHPIGMIAEDHELLQSAIQSDAEFLKSINIIDFSLVVGFAGPVADELNQFSHMTVGIIDYLRQFDLIKRVESVSKSVGMIAGQSSPTIIEPALYAKRFCDAIGRYFMPVTPIDSDRNGLAIHSQ